MSVETSTRIAHVEAIDAVLARYAAAIEEGNRHGEARAVADFYRVCPNLKPGSLEKRRKEVLAEQADRVDAKNVRRLVKLDQREAATERRRRRLLRRKTRNVPIHAPALKDPVKPI
jgi:hypothetical protein